LDPVLVETFLSFFAPGFFHRAFGLQTPVEAPGRLSVLFGLSTFGALARGPEVDEVTHLKLGGNQMCCC
jgi:hypothetical protein